MKPLAKTAFIEDLRELLRPYATKNGPLPPLLVSLTFLTGLVDAFSYLVLGHVFVANMTGNIIFLGFAFVGTRGLSIPASIVALGSFLIGSGLGGKLEVATNGRRARLLALSSGAHASFLLVAVVLAALTSTPVEGGFRYALIVVLAISMGVQNAASRTLAVPDLTTTVLTMTLTGVGADSTLVGGPGSKVTRRLFVVVVMLLGALFGALFVMETKIYVSLIVAFAIAAGVSLTCATLGSTNPEWT